MEDKTRQDLGAALGRIPSGLFILTAQHEDHRGGMLASWVQQVCFQPPMASVAIAKGRAIMPLISESRRFALCQLSQSEKLMMRKFAGGYQPDEDPFLGFELITPTLLGLPILASSMAYLECELNCHMDVEGDHDLFVGVVRSGCTLHEGPPYVHLRENGFKY